MFDTVDTAHDCIRIATGVISTLKIFPDKMLAGLSADMLATDLAEYLVRKGAFCADISATVCMQRSRSKAAGFSCQCMMLGTWVSSDSLP